MIAADAWNKLVAQVKRARAMRGVRVDTNYQPNGVVVSGDVSALWRHPWFIEPRWEWKEDGTGEWRGFIRPGFVNGRDAYLTMPADWPEGTPPDEDAKPHDVALTDDPTPYLVLGGWRNPLTPASLSASASGQLIASAAEGYPKFFARR